MKWLCSALLAATVTTAQAQCLKEVFNQFCLGGELTAEQLVGSRYSEIKDGKGSAAFTAEGTLTFVRVFDNKVETIVRAHQPATGLRYTDLKARLINIYGTPKTLRQMPDFATDLSGMELAINTGRGRIMDVWQLDGWSVRLIWNSSKSVDLVYQHDGLVSQRRKANPNPSGL